MKYYLCLCFTLSAVLRAIHRSLLNISLYQRLMLFCDQRKFKTTKQNKKNRKAVYWSIPLEMYFLPPNSLSCTSDALNLHKWFGRVRGPASTQAT